MNPRHLARLFESFRTHGSTAALARVFDAAAPALLAVARRIARERADAEDALQATFLVAIERASSWDAARPLEPWLFGILVRQLALARRRAARAVDPSRLDPGRVDDPTLAVERAELVATVTDAVRQLPEKDRAVLEPWLFEELRGRELARRAGVAGSTLRMRLRRGLTRLRRALPAGLGATAFVLSAADRSALASVKAGVLAAAARGKGAAAASTAATSASGVSTSFGAKAAAAALLAAALLGGGALLRARRQAPAPATRTARPQPESDDGVAASAATAVAISPRRQSEGRGAANDPSGPIATSTTTISRTNGAHEAPPPDELSGVVVDAQGAPVGAARVLVFDDDAEVGGALAESVTAEDGSFRFRGVDAGGVHVTAMKAGVGRAARQTAPMGTNVKLELGVGRRFEGRVVDEDGTPAANARVELADEEARFVGTQRATADGDGRYVFAAVHGRVRFVRATTAAPPEFGSTTLDPDDDASSAPPGIVVRPTRRAEITVAARGDGRPVARALVILHAGGDALAAAGLDVRGAGRLDALEPFAVALSSDAAGRVVCDGLPRCGGFHVAVAAPGFAPAARSFSTADEAPVDERIELEPAGAIEGVARRGDGTPLAEATVAVEVATPLRELRAPPGSLDALRSIVVDGATPFTFATRTRADGTFRLEGLPPLPACSLHVEGSRRASAYAWIDALRAGEVRSGIVVTLGAKVRIEGTIVAEDGSAPTATQLWLQPCSTLAKVDREGRFSFDLEPHGAATIWAVAPGYVHARCDVAAPLPAVSRIEMTLHRGASISGAVVDPEKHPVAGARLIVWPAQPTFEERRRTGGWISEVNLGAVTTRNDGRFEIRGLPDRALRLVVSADGFAAAESSPIAAGSRDLAITLRPAR